MSVRPDRVFPYPREIRKSCDGNFTDWFSLVAELRLFGSEIVESMLKCGEFGNLKFSSSLFLPVSFITDFVDCLMEKLHNN